MLIRKYMQIYDIKFHMFTIYRKLTKFYAAYKLLMLFQLAQKFILHSYGISQ